MEIFTYLFFVWQVLNAFAPQEDPEMRGKSITRLQTITNLYKVLEKCLAG